MLWAYTSMITVQPVQEALWIHTINNRIQKLHVLLLQSNNQLENPKICTYSTLYEI